MIKTIKLKKIAVFVIIFVIVFGISYYKIFLSGNNINKNRSTKKIDETLNSFNSYSAEVEVKIKSNKTENVYQMYQEVGDDFSIQEVKNGGDIAGMKIELNGNNLTISNSRIELSKVYSNYTDLLGNAMFLNTFTKDFFDDKNFSDTSVQDGEIILEVELKNNQNTYIKYKKLYINEKTLIPTKMEIKNNTKNETICIVYNNVELKHN